MRSVVRGLKCAVMAAVFAALCLAGIRLYLSVRGHGAVWAEANRFTESAKRIENPNRGFYHLYGFEIEDEETDYREEIAVKFCQDTETSLALIEVNLNRFRDRDISEQGLANIKALMEALRTTKKQLIVRFLYAWDGQGEEAEPDSLDRILGHMRQCEPVFSEYSDVIFTLQGVFVGAYGEMHGSRYLSAENLRTLLQTLGEVTDPSVYLAVRTPAFWRMATGLADPSEASRQEGTLAYRLGLFNDGMLGSVSDIGTYADEEEENQENAAGTLSEKWSRQEELAFQEILCAAVPNGGETVLDNAYNDFENAVRDLSAMHVTYLNRDYDAGVLEKWAGTAVTENGCYAGMDGLSYMERHLGYRLVLREADMAYDWKKDMLSVGVTVQNVGFAPLYREAEARILLCNRDTGEIRSYLTGQDVRTLAGGTEMEETLTLQAQILLAGEPAGEYAVFLELTDTFSGRRIVFGNEEEPQQYGYEIGRVKIEAVPALPGEWF